MDQETSNALLQAQRRISRLEWILGEVLATGTRPLPNEARDVFIADLRRAWSEGPEKGHPPTSPSERVGPSGPTTLHEARARLDAVAKKFYDDERVKEVAVPSGDERRIRSIAAMVPSVDSYQEANPGTSRINAWAHMAAGYMERVNDLGTKLDRAHVWIENLRDENERLRKIASEEHPQSMVAAFSEVFEQPIATEPGVGDGFPAALRIHLIREEANEVIAAIEERDLMETIDGLCDLLYVVYGTAVCMNIDIAPFFEEVHAANMRKLGSDGKPIFRTDIEKRVIKPEGWKPPDLIGVLEREYPDVFRRIFTPHVSDGE